MDRQDLKAAADLAMLDLSDQELESFSGAFEQMLEYMSVMDQADTDGLEATTHMIDGEVSLRDDEPVTDARERSSLLKEPKHTVGTAVSIPRVLP